MTRSYIVANGRELIKLFVKFIIKILLTVHFKVHFMSKLLFILLKPSCWYIYLYMYVLHIVQILYLIWPPWYLGISACLLSDTQERRVSSAMAFSPSYILKKYKKNTEFIARKQTKIDFPVNQGYKEYPLKRKCPFWQFWKLRSTFRPIHKTCPRTFRSIS